MGLGAYPPGDPLFLGMLGMHGTYAANMAVTECDLLLALGVRFDDRVTGKLELFSPHSKKVHIDIDPSEFQKCSGKVSSCWRCKKRYTCCYICQFVHRQMNGLRKPRNGKRNTLFLYSKRK